MAEGAGDRRAFRKRVVFAQGQTSSSPCGVQNCWLLCRSDSDELGDLGKGQKAEKVDRSVWGQRQVSEKLLDWVY